jgi:hypothetical protein
VSLKVPTLLIAAAILAGAAGAAEPPVAPAAAAPAAGKPEALSEVIIKAQRAQLVPRVSNFVYQVAGLENEESLSRWQEPVCPLVTGLPRQEGEFVLGRVSEIARAAAVPLAGEHCKPNLYIFVTRQPQQLLQAMENHNFAVTFGPNAMPTIVDEFIAHARPIRVWYSSGMRTPEGAAMHPGAPAYTLISNGPMIGPLHLYNDSERSSHLMLAHIWSLSVVYVIADQSRLQGLSRGQFADYVAMVGLAEINPGAHLGDAPTILKLFDGAPDTAPAGLSDWDQAFLKSLYATELGSKLQRNQIARSIVRDIVH